MKYNLTIIVPPPHPDSVDSLRRELREQIRNIGFEKLIREIVDDYYKWDEDPDPVSATRKKRATLIFSKDELEALVPAEIHKIINDELFLNENIRNS